VSSFRQRKAATRLREAEAAHARANWPACERAAAAAVQLDASLHAAWTLWADSLERQAKLIEAARVLADALAAHPDDPSLTLSRVHALIETGQFAAAGRLLAGLRARFPAAREPLAYLARLLRDVRDFGPLQALLDEALAGPWAGDAELTALATACARWRGQHDDPRPAPKSMREWLLSEHGVVLLGTGHDDGIQIPWYSTYLCSNYDVVATLARLLGFADQFGWRWAQVAALDPAARPLAELIAAGLDASVVALPEPGSPLADYPDPDRCLAVASFLEPGWTREEHGDWAQRCAELGSLFGFGALDYQAHERLPPLLGLAGGERICLPWWRLGEARIGFARFGLIDDLPAEIDGRAPDRIAADYRAPLARFETGPNFVVALRHLLDHRQQLQPGLRARSEFARILPQVPARPGPARALDDALERGDVAEFLRALGILEAELERVGARELAVLERWFRTAPEVRSRLADLLYRVAPARLAALLHELVARPAAEVPIHERDGLLHLYGCNPWTVVEPSGQGEDPSPATAELRRWLNIGSLTNRSEIVQSKYGLHHLAEARDHEGDGGFAAILEQLLADAPAIVLGTLRWLHDNPQHHALIGLVEPLIDHDHADVVFEALQCLRAAQRPVAMDRLAPILAGQRLDHPRLISAGVEILELLPIVEAHPQLIPRLDHPEPAIAWAAARALIRGGADLRERVQGAEQVAAKIIAVEQAGGDPRQLLRALASADAFELFEPLLRADGSPSRTKIVAAALTPALLALDDPRLLAYLRQHRDAFGLDPAYGYASYLARHGDPEHDRDAVYGARGATEVRAGYEALAVLARWGDAAARIELGRALSYAPPFRLTAFEAWFRVLRSTEFERLDQALASGEPEELASVWTILVDGVGESSWTAGLGEHWRAEWAREAEWARFIEARLRGEIPSKFEVGAQSAHFAVLADLLPHAFTDVCERALVGNPDRLGVDLLEWLAVHRPESARAWAGRLGDSPHWGIRQVARRILARHR
jgi:hypothetical protein